VSQHTLCGLGGGAQLDQAHAALAVRALIHVDGEHVGEHAA